jgi:RNA polymerase sigma-70 factor, ECF subfamily
MHEVTVDHSAPPPTTSEGPDTGRYFADHYMPVMRLCMRHLRDECDAEDAVQEVFRRAVQQGDGLRGDPLPWLITVAKNVCRDELRRRRTGRAALERNAALSPSDAATATNDHENPERAVVGHLFVRELLGRLTPAERRVVAARVYHDATGVEAAHAFGVSSSTTRVLLARARQKLRHYLEEGQVAFGFIPLLGTRLVHSVRRHMLQRPGSAEAGAAMLLPAALMVTVMMGPGMDAVPRGGVAMAPVALGAGIGAVHDALPAADRAAVGSVVYVHRAPAASGHAGAAPSYTVAKPSTLIRTGLTPDIEQVYVTDIQPSPNYPQDHTVLMAGTTAGCTPPPCTQVFSSADGGASWTYVGGSGSAGPLATLVLPPSEFAHHVFYMMDMLGLEETTDGGHTFLPSTGVASGFAGAAPAGSGADVLLANYALWELGSGVAPRAITPFTSNQEATGAPLTISDGSGGFVTLQPVANLVGSTNDPRVLRCSSLCTSSAALPFKTTTVQLIASPNVAVDHTIFAIAYGEALAISRDSGQSFSLVAPNDASQLTVVPFGAGHRLVEIVQHGTSGVLKTSDDDGLTWQVATVDPSLGMATAQHITSLAPGRLIASIARSDWRWRFACSTDGSAWSACAPDTTS